MRHLVQRGVEPYCPMFLEPPWHTRAPRGPMPLFSSYIFVSCRLPEELNAVRFCPGVLHPVVFAGELATVDQSLIDYLREKEAEHGYIVPETFLDKLTKGQRVRVMAGPLRGYEGIFHGYMRGGQRARVLMEMLRARHRIEVDANALKALSA